MSNTQGDPRRDSKISLTIHSTRSSPAPSIAETTASEHQRKDIVDLAEFTAAPFGLDLYNPRTPENRALLWRQDIRIIPLCSFIYLLCFLDRANIANARIMNAENGNSLELELGISDSQYALVLMTFLIGFTLFEVPSNIFLKRLTPSKWIAFLMFAWGAVTIGTGCIKNFSSLIATRFLLGLFEAGFLPNLIYYLTFWYRVDERSIRVAVILASATLAGAFGGAIAFGISHMNQVASLAAWRWLFILEGIPSCLAAILVYLFLPDYPESSSFLSLTEKSLAAERLAFEGSKGTSKMITWREAVATFRDWRLYAHYVIYFAMSVSFSSLSLFTPSITAGLGFDSIEAQLMTVPPWAAAYIVTLLTAFLSDRYNMRATLSAASMLISMIGFLASALLPPGYYTARYICLVIACSGVFASTPPLLGWLSGNVHGTSAAGLAIGLNVSFGTPGQIVGVWIYQKEEAMEGYFTGHWTNVGMMVLGAVGCVALRWWYRRENRRILESGEERRLWKL